MERRSASAGERRSAEWVAERLAAAGADDVRLETFRYQHSFGHAQALHYAAGVLAALASGRAGRALAAASFASFELEYSGRRQWTRPLLPAGEGTSVVAHLPARGKRRGFLILVAHHDAAHTGLMWDPRLLRSGDARAARTGRRASLALVPEIGFLLAASRRRGPRVLAAALLGLAAALAFEVTGGPTVPGANDNASGVAGVIALAERLAAEPLDGVEVFLVVPGCEESGMGGMAAWLAGAKERLDPRKTLVLGLDSIGSGEPIVLTAEGGLWPVRYRDEDVALVERGADLAGVPRPRRWRLGGWTDPALARLAGLPTASILSVRDGGITNYHLPSDTPDRVDFGSVEACVGMVEGTARVWARQLGV